jgi:hypothetical protein
MLCSGSDQLVVHQLPCFGGGFFLCLITGGLFLCLAPFPWGKVSDPSASPLLSVCCDGSLFVFQFCSTIWLWVLLTGPGDEPCGLLPVLLQAAAYHPPAVGPSAFPAFVYWYFVPRSAPCFPPFFGSLSTTPPPLLCASFQFVVYCSVFFLQGYGVSLPSGLCWFIPGVTGGVPHDAWHSPVWSVDHLPSMLGVGGWRQWQPTYSLSITWCGEAFHRLGV